MHCKQKRWRVQFLICEHLLQTSAITAFSYALCIVKPTLLLSHILGIWYWIFFGRYADILQPIWLTYSPTSNSRDHFVSFVVELKYSIVMHTHIAFAHQQMHKIQKSKSKNLQNLATNSFFILPPIFWHVKVHQNVPLRKYLLWFFLMIAVCSFKLLQGDISLSFMWVWFLFVLYGEEMANHLSESMPERTFQYQSSLPPLPVPSLEMSLSKYLESGGIVALYCVVLLLCYRYTKYSPWQLFPKTNSESSIWP